MNKSNPLVPQGSLLEQQSKGRRRIKIYVYCGVAVHVLFLGGLLMIGCGKDNDPVKKADVVLPPLDNTNPPPVELPVASNPPPVTAYVPPTNLPPVVTPVIPAPAPLIPAPAPAAAATEYKVAKGDSYYTIHKKFGVSIKALEAANPTMPANKLKPGATLQIPAPTAAVVTPGTTPGTPAVTPTTDAGESYTVKSGDNLTKIATAHHVSVKALRAANNLKTDRLKVGDKLKLPAKAAGAPAVADATPVPPPVVPAPVSTTAPTLPVPGATR